ncbi:hypothetical protein K1719_002364 [Acacia pycnantha]|nr:hypothetical protein K1719_002364 [Acacia pycnantha]
MQYCRWNCSLQFFQCIFSKLSLQTFQGSVSEHTSECGGYLHIEYWFTSSHLRSIEHMYSDHGLLALEALRNNPIVVVPLMLGRLEEKLGQLKSIHLELKKIWAQVCADNHAKSLAFRSKRAYAIFFNCMKQEPSVCIVVGLNLFE